MLNTEFGWLKLQGITEGIFDNIHLSNLKGY